jgi:hypothetical protein
MTAESNFAGICFGTTLQMGVSYKRSSECKSAKVSLKSRVAPTEKPAKLVNLMAANGGVKPTPAFRVVDP